MFPCFEEMKRVSERVTVWAVWVTCGHCFTPSLLLLHSLLAHYYLTTDTLSLTLVALVLQQWSDK